jgi:hypothetical protein
MGDFVSIYEITWDFENTSGDSLVRCVGWTDGGGELNSPAHGHIDGGIYANARYRLDQAVSCRKQPFAARKVEQDERSKKAALQP